MHLARTRNIKRQFGSEHRDRCGGLTVETIGVVFDDANANVCVPLRRSPFPGFDARLFSVADFSARVLIQNSHLVLHRYAASATRMGSLRIHRNGTVPVFAPRVRSDAASPG